MKMLIYFSLIVIFYFVLVLFWNGKRKMKASGQYKGAISYAFTAMMGIVGAIVMSLQYKAFTELRYSENLSFFLAAILMIAVSTILFFTFVRRENASE